VDRFWPALVNPWKKRVKLDWLPMRWMALEWMGLQRHLKVLGIFCRLKHRDGKPHYSTDLPRFFAYATRVAQRYAPLAPLLTLLEPLSGQNR